MMQDDYASIWMYRLKWAYLLLVVLSLMTPVFYVMYISFNENGFGAHSYVFTFDWYMVIFSDKLMLNALGWTLSLAVATDRHQLFPMAILAAKFYKSTKYKIATVFLLLSPLFVASDIMGSALLVYFKNLNKGLEALSDMLGNEWFYGWFDLGFMTALIGLIIYTLPYAFYRGSHNDGQISQPTNRGCASLRSLGMARLLGHRVSANSCRRIQCLCVYRHSGFQRIHSNQSP